jgi:hypothetical protein
MDESNKKRLAQTSSGSAAEAERRRIGKVVHDDRGNASVLWHDAPADYQRPVLEVLGEPKLAIKNEESYDPYARGGARSSPSPKSGNTTRTDLRKLSEWIKMMRELEERKRNGGGED